MDAHSSNQPESIDIWVVEKRLGAGGMGTVYRCHNRDAPRIKAAIKVLANHLQASDTVRRRFIREAELLFELEHPHIVKVRNIRMDAAPPFIEMAFVNGVPLSQILTKGPLPPREAARITAQIASALAHCHARGVRHRDVKPANIIVRDGNATLVDFGVAINVQGTLSQGHRGGSLGTLSYTPPEWGGRGVDPTAWDAYALGIVLYESLLGRMAFPVPDELDLRESVVQQIDVKRGTPLLDPGTKVPEVLREVCRSLTLFNPSERTTDMGAVADTLVHWLGGDPTVLAAPARTDPPVRLGAELLPDPAAPVSPTIGVQGEVENIPETEAPVGATWMHVTDELAELLRADARPSVPNVPSDESSATGEPPRLARWGFGLGAMAVAVLGAVVIMVDGSTSELITTPVVGSSLRIPVPPVRSVQVGLPDKGPDVDVQVFLDEEDISDEVAAGGVRTLPVGRHETLLLVGADCLEGGSDCLERQAPLEVSAGSGEQKAILDWPDLPQVKVALTPEPPTYARARIGDGPWMFASDLRAPYGGRVQLVLQEGDCPDLPCGAECPSSCREVAREVALPIRPDGPVSVELALPRSAKKALARHQSGRGQPVSRSAFAQWLRAHPAMQKREMASVVSHGHTKYLKGWDGNQPPAGTERQPVWSVTPSVAVAYCRSQGATLSAVEAVPQEWPPSQGDAEYRRRADGKVVALGYTGQSFSTSNEQVSARTRIVCEW